MKEGRGEEQQISMVNIKVLHFYLNESILITVTSNDATASLNVKNACFLLLALQQDFFCRQRNFFLTNYPRGFLFTTFPILLLLEF